MASNESSISFSLLDTGFEGFPGTVLTIVTYAVSSFASGPQGEMRPRLTTSITAHALDEPTPIMQSTHIYWNLNAFKAKDVLNDTTVWMPYSDRWIMTDPILIPTGEIGTTASTPGLDFTSPKTVGDAVADAAGLCGGNCTGVDNAFIIDRPDYVSSEDNLKVLSMWSDTTGKLSHPQTYARANKSPQQASRWRSQPISKVFRSIPATARTVRYP